MQIKRLLAGKTMFDCNCYGILSEKGAVIIDPGTFDEELVRFFETAGIEEKLILITHAHIDHIMGAEELRGRTGVKIAASKNAALGLSDTAVNLSRGYNKHISFKSDIELSDGEVLNVGDIKIEAIYTPGHTDGCTCYKIGDNLFSGDTLFLESIGRTDLPTANLNSMKESLLKLCRLDKSITVYPGHGPKTTIEHEKAFNMYINSF